MKTISQGQPLGSALPQGIALVLRAPTASALCRGGWIWLSLGISVLLREQGEEYHKHGYLGALPAK